MKQLRRIFNGLTILSTILFAVTAVLWLRSYFADDYLYLQSLEDSSQKADWTDTVAFWHEDCVKVGGGGIGMMHLVRSDEVLRRRPKKDWRTAVGQGPLYRTNSYGDYPVFAILATDMHVWRNFSYGRFSHSWSGQVLHGWFFVVPFWGICFPSMILPLLWLLRRRQMRKQCSLGQCSSCGYDLRAAPERCPECGAVPAKKGGPSSVGI